MTLNKPSIAATTSPDSSEEAESNDVTPATKLSPLSPRDVYDRTKSMSTGIVRPKVPPAFNLKSSQSNLTAIDQVHSHSPSTLQDPFVTGPRARLTDSSYVGSSKLSPTASLFTPGSRLIHGHVSSDPTSTARWNEGSPSSWSGSTGDNVTSITASSLRPWIPRRLPDGKPAWSNGPISPAAGTGGTSCPLARGWSVQFGSFSSESGVSRMIAATVNSVGFVKELCAFVDVSRIEQPGSLVFASPLIDNSVNSSSRALTLSLLPISSLFGSSSKTFVTRPGPSLHCSDLI